MEKQICPVCSLYLREGISLKAHLQTHSKEKVIEALLKQDPLNTDNVVKDNNISNSTSCNSATISVAENRFYSLNRSTLSVLPSSSSYVQSNNQVTQTTQSMSYGSQFFQNANGFPMTPLINNNVPATGVSNILNPLITYYQFITNDGNVVLIPTNSVSQNPLLIPNNFTPNPIVNSCMVMPPTETVQSVPEVSPTSSAAPSFNSVPVQATVDIPVNNAKESVNSMHSNNENIIQNELTISQNINDEEKETDDEVASIFDVTREESGHEQEKNESHASCHSDLEDDKSSCTSVNCLNGQETGSDMSPLFAPSENAIRRITPLSPMKENNFSFISHDNDSDLSVDKEEENKDSCTSPKDFHSPHLLSLQNQNLEYGLEQVANSTKESTNTDESDRQEMSNCHEMLPSTSSEKNNFSFALANPDNATHILPDGPEEQNRENDQYILPNDDIPRSSSPSDSSDYFVGLRNSFLTSASLISSVNKTMFADVDLYNKEKNKTDFFGSFEDPIRAALKNEDRPFLTSDSIFNCCSPIDDDEENEENEEEDKESENVYRNSCENLESGGNSRISPFNIQTDERMPPRGELSGQESLSGTESSVWELEVQQRLQRFSVTCKGENDVKTGITSMITETNIKKDGESSLQNSQIENTQVVDETILRQKKVREFRCFYCKQKFDNWKSRQSHLENQHAGEDCLSVESLFGKRLKYKIENDVKNEDGVAEEKAVVEESTRADSIVCRICGATFDTNFFLLQHLKEKHDIKKRSTVCPTCFAQFNNAEDYQEHIEKVHPYECMTCGKTFNTRPGYMLHQKRHMKVKPYSCDSCDKSFVTKQKLTEHVSIHTGEAPIKCDICDCRFRRYSNYQQHKKYLHLNCKRKLKDFICHCGEVFHSKLKLLWHQEIHDEKPKQCPFCSERFVHTSSLTRHMRKWHTETYLNEWVKKKMKNLVECPVCNVSYLHSSLATHMRIHDGVKPFSCSECSKSFRTKWNLQLHKWTHMSRSAKPYKCKLCVKAYFHKTDYDAHIRSHNNSRPYSCNICGRQFIRKYNCLRHTREHNEPRSHKCKVCGKLFSRSYYLTEHEKVHTGVKPHTCHICGKLSATKSNHNKHVKMHNAVRESLNSEG